MNEARSLPIVLSGLVCPGLGQLFQRRWLAGTFFLVTTLAIFVHVCFLVFHPVIQNLQLAFGNAQGELVPIPFRSIFLEIGGAIVLYAISLADTWRAARKQHAQSAGSEQAS